MKILQYFRTRSRSKHPQGVSGFTLIETLVAISILMMAIVAPMSLAAQSLGAAYYARDQITAFYLAQEAIEVVRSVRDGNILRIAEGQQGVNIFDGIPSTTGQAFTVDSLADPSAALVLCPLSGCPPLQTDGNVYGYHNGWTNTTFVRSVTAKLINNNPDELRITVTVTWQEGTYQQRTFSINEDLYRWVNNQTS
jgi:type II secretory pathway pseudopilin PulG